MSNPSTNIMNNNNKTILSFLKSNVLTIINALLVIVALVTISSLNNQMKSLDSSIQGLKKGYTQPKLVTRGVVAQIDAIINSD